MSNFASKLGDIVKAIAGTDNVNRADLMKHYNSAVIVAAGNGTRMGPDHTLTKQMMNLGSMPVVVRTISQFEACEFINEIVVVAREEEMSKYDEFREEYGFKKVTAVVKGGDTRQRSVLEGFKRISEKSEYVAIHDGARCLVNPAMIENVMYQTYIYGCATAAEKSKDTVKNADKSGFITATIDRETLWHAQTPQIFKTDVYRAAAFIALKNGYQATDDCMLAENIGFKIKLVDCGHENIKLTTPDDFYLGEAILKMRAERCSE